MLQSIDVYNEQGNWAMTLAVASDSQDRPYLIKEVDGLGPVDAAIHTSSDVAIDGARYQGSSVSSRNIVFNIEYNPTYFGRRSASTLRNGLYSVFPPKAFIKLRFTTTDHPLLEISGYVESHDPVIFSREPSVQISIICPDPYFRSLNQVQYSGRTNVLNTIPNVGNAPSGITVQTSALINDASNIRATTTANKQAHFYYGYRGGDLFRFTTVSGSKGALLSRGGDSASALDQLRYGGLDITIDSRYDKFRLDIPSNNITYTITFTPAYLGI